MLCIRSILRTRTQSHCQQSLRRGEVSPKEVGIHEALIGYQGPLYHVILAQVKRAAKALQKRCRGRREVNVAQQVLCSDVMMGPNQNELSAFVTSVAFRIVLHWAGKL